MGISSSSMPNITGEKLGVEQQERLTRSLYRTSFSHESAEMDRMTDSPTDSWMSYTCETPCTDIGEESSRVDSALSTRSLYSTNSEESLVEEVRDVADDLKDMLLEVENLKKSQTIYDSANEDLEGMIKDAGRISKRNSQVMAEDFDIFSVSEKEFLKADQDMAKKRYSSHLMPTDTPSSRVTGIRKALSTEFLASAAKKKLEDSKQETTPNENGSLLHSGHGEELEDQMKTNNPWDADEKVKGTTHTLKVIVVGDAGVGKTSLIRQLTQQQFSKNVMPTLGVDFSAKNLPTVDNSVIRLHLWDVAGQERYRCLSRAYLKGCQACVVVFDVTRKDTFDHVEVWKRDIDTKCGPIPSLLLGNKNDLPFDISQKELQRAADFLNFTTCSFISAKKFGPLVTMVQKFAQKVKEEINAATEAEGAEELSPEKREHQANLVNLAETMSKADPSPCRC